MAHLFRAETGKSRIEYLARARVEVAKRLLLESGGSLTWSQKSLGFVTRLIFHGRFVNTWVFGRAISGAAGCPDVPDPASGTCRACGSIASMAGPGGFELPYLPFQKSPLKCRRNFRCFGRKFDLETFAAASCGSEQTGQPVKPSD
jgi:AraC-like DNA-binding protein